MQSDIIGDIYDATLDPSLWEAVLERTARFVGGGGASLFSKDATRATGAVAYSYGIDPHYSRLYFEKYVKLDPSTTGHLLAEIEEPIATGDFISYEEFLETRFYREWAQPQGLVDFVSCVLDKSATAAAMFGVFRHEEDGVVDERARERMRVVSPHYRRAVLIGRLIDLRQSQAATFAGILDGLSAGLFLVDRYGRIIHANAAGRTILAADDFLYSARGHLMAHDASVDRALRAAVVAAAAGDPAACVGSIAVPAVAEDREHYVLNVLPLTSGAVRRVGIAGTAAAALFVHKASADAPSLPESVARYYKLTPTELRVLLAVVEVGGGPAVAEALGVAESTVKTHLHRLYQKTGTRRQVDLVKLVTGFSSPVLA